MGRLRASLGGDGRDLRDLDLGPAGGSVHFLNAGGAAGTVSYRGFVTPGGSRSGCWPGVLVSEGFAGAVRGVGAAAARLGGGADGEAAAGAYSRQVDVGATRGW